MGKRHTDDVECELCNEKLKTAHPYMVLWFRDLKKRHPSVHISWAHRDQSTQNWFFKEGKSNATYPNSLHNKLPAEALDIFQIDADGVARWSKPFALKVDQENQEAHWKVYSGKDIKLPNGGRDYLHFYIRVGEHEERA